MRRRKPRPTEKHSEAFPQVCGNASLMLEITSTLNILVNRLYELFYKVMEALHGMVGSRQLKMYARQITLLPDYIVFFIRSIILI